MAIPAGLTDLGYTEHFFKIFFYSIRAALQQAFAFSMTLSPHFFADFVISIRAKFIQLQFGLHEKLN
jgi:hypothetical protein